MQERKVNKCKKGDAWIRKHKGSNTQLTNSKKDKIGKSSKQTSQIPQNCIKLDSNNTVKLMFNIPGYQEMKTTIKELYRNWNKSQNLPTLQLNLSYIL